MEDNQLHFSFYHERFLMTPVKLFYIELIQKEKNTVHKCEVIETTPYYRTLKLANKKVIKAHPEGVRRKARYFPQVFESEFDSDPEFFMFRNRILASRNRDNLTEVEKYLVPDVKQYVWQSFTRELIDSINLDNRMLLVGHAGSGKTSVAEQLAARINQPVLRVNFNGQTTISDFLGHMGVAAGKTYWVDGVLPKAMREGYWLIMDEIDFADPAILSILHPVLEPKGVLVLKENAGEVIKPHKNFRIFGTANSIGGDSFQYSGTNKMNDAFLDRWDIFRISYLPERQEKKVVKFNAPSLSGYHIRRIIQAANSMRTGGDKVMVTAFSTRKCIDWAKKMTIYRNPLFCAQITFLQSYDQDTRAAVELLIKTIWSDRDTNRKPR